MVKSMAQNMAKITVSVPSAVAEAAKQLSGTGGKTNVSAIAAAGLTKEVVRLSALELRRGGWPPQQEALDWAVTLDEDRQAASS